MTLWSVARRRNIRSHIKMTQEEISAANRKSALEQVEQDERNERLKADAQAEEFMNSRPYRPHTFIGEEDRKTEALQEVQRENVEASRNN
jgi:transcriptional regulator with XRE-family HTH domain